MLLSQHVYINSYKILQKKLKKEIRDGEKRMEKEENNIKSETNKENPDK